MPSSKIESIRRELVALKRSIDPHISDSRRYEILRDDLNPIWGRLEALLHADETNGQQVSDADLEEIANAYDQGQNGTFEYHSSNILKMLREVFVLGYKTRCLSEEPDALTPSQIGQAIADNCELAPLPHPPRCECRLCLPVKASGELPLCDCDPDFGCKEYDPAIFRCCQQEMERRAAQENGDG